MKLTTSWSLAVCLLVGYSVTVHAESWKDTKARWEDCGATVTIMYGGDVFAELAGGLPQRTYVGNLNLELLLDGERLFHRPGLSFFVECLSIHGGQPSLLLGDAQGISNISAPSKLVLYEVWFEYNLFANHFSVLAGLYDLNSQFYVLQSAGLFLNGSFGVGPEFSGSGVAGPSIFPSTSPGVRLTFKPKSNIEIRGAVFDGVPVDRPDDSISTFTSGDGVLLVSEAVFLNREASISRKHKVRFRIGRAAGSPSYDHKVAIGGWHYTATFPDLSAIDANGNPVAHRGSSGVYAIADATLFRSKTTTERRLSGFVEGGLGDGRVNRFGSYFGAGLVGYGPLKMRPDDELGLAVAVAHNGPAYQRQQIEAGGGTFTTETAIELTYLAQVTSWLAVQPDFSM